MSFQNSPKTESGTLRVVQSVCGTFHHFDLARELHALGCLERIYSTFNRGRLRREGLPDEFVGVFPWIHPAMMLLVRNRINLPRKLKWELDLVNKTLFDRWVASHMPACDVFVGISGCGLESGKGAQERGGKYICDRGSSHIRVQDQILCKEFARWGHPEAACDPRMIEREEREYAQADAITVPSSFAARSFIELGIPKDKVHVIPYGVRLEKFHPVAEPSSDTFEVLFVGQVGLRKGIPYLLQAFAGFRHPRKRLRVVGSVQPHIREVLKQLPQDHVEFLGSKPQAEIARYMSSSHVMVLPSIEEGLALVQGQAMACGCALISTTNTGGRDLFTDGVEGFEVPIRSPSAITERLEMLADSPKLLAQMREAALARVKSIGGWFDYSQKFFALMKELAS